MPRHLHQSQNLGGAAAGGKTPYGAGARTPARTPGHTTPGHLSVRQVPGRTPNPYGGQTPAIGFGGSVPTSSYATPAPQPLPAYASTPQSLGYQTPSAFSRPPITQPPSHVPPGMNPQRAAMIQNFSGWGTDGGW